MLVTQKMIWDELIKQRKILTQLIHREAEHSIEEVSLYRASKLLRKGPESIIQDVKCGNLNARIYKDKNHKTRYRFRVADIRKFQVENNYKVSDLPDKETIQNFDPNSIVKNFHNRKQAV